MKKIFWFWEDIENIPYKVLNENVVRMWAKIMFLLWSIALINVLFLDNYFVLPYISWFLFLNFFISIFINPKFWPIGIFSRYLVWRYNPVYVWAIQKRFALFLGFLLTGTIFVLSLYLLNDISYFRIVCFLCLMCIVLMWMEWFLWVCAWCNIYKFY